jgi:Zn-dependent metalloprotease
VRFERRIDGLPLFDGDVVVGVGAKNAIILVNGSDVPAQVKGRARISRKTAIRAAKAAIPGLENSDTARTERGWYAAGQVIRPVWRVDLTAARPPGDWRSYVDAETGKVLLRVDLRAYGAGLNPR